MRCQFSIATLLWLVAASAVLCSMARWMGYDGVIVVAPFLGAGARHLLAPKRPVSALPRWAGETLAGGLVVTGVCLADPRLHIARALDLAFGVSICFLYGLGATAALEASLMFRRRLGEWVGGAVRCRPGALGKGVEA